MYRIRLFRSPCRYPEVLDVDGSEPPWPVAMIDPIAGPGSVLRIAGSVAELVAAIGITRRK